MGDECNCLKVSTFFSVTFLGKWDEAGPFPVLWPLLGLPESNGRKQRGTKEPLVKGEGE